MWARVKVRVGSLWKLILASALQAGVVSLFGSNAAAASSFCVMFVLFLFYVCRVNEQGYYLQPFTNVISSHDGRTIWDKVEHGH